ncbi:kinesin light chain-like isoform X2 [Sycon ciliatum]|uniref:kinesin light chain-like isoform X2 n=1 Tax=Sycon ciliatum TaxID=27933 RepID=UPI0031F71585
MASSSSGSGGHAAKPFQSLSTSAGQSLTLLEKFCSQQEPASAGSSAPGAGAGRSKKRKASSFDAPDGGVISRTIVDLTEHEEDERRLAEKSRMDASLMKTLVRTKEDAHFLVETALYCQLLQGENEKLKAQVGRISDENRWLRDEVNQFQDKLRTCEISLVQVTEERDHFKHMATVLQDDTGGDSLMTDEDKQQAQSLPSPVGVSMEDSAPEDEQDGGIEAIEESTMSPSNRSSVASSASDAMQVPQRLRTLHNLVIQYASQGRYEVAVPLCKQALDDIERTQGKDHPDCATMLNILAMVYRDQNKFKEASNLLQDALRIREKALGDEHPAVAATLNNLAVLYGKRSKFSDAEPLCKRALAIREKVLGSKHPDVAKQLNNLALICQNQGKFDEVESYYERALDIYKTTLGPGDANVAKTMNNLASCYVKQGKYKAAENLYRSVLEQAHTKEFGPGLTEVAHNSAVSRAKASRLTGQNNIEIQSQTSSLASAYAEYGGWHRAMGSTDSPTVQTTLKNLGALYRRQGKMDVADTFDDISVRSRKKALEVVKKSKVVEVLGSEAVTGNGVGAADAESAHRARSNSSTPVDHAADTESIGKSSLKRRGSFSKLKGSVGKAISKVVGDGKEKRRRSSSLPRSPSSASSEELLHRNPAQTPDQTASPILADSNSLMSGAPSHESRRRGRGPLKTPHSRVK